MTMIHLQDKNRDRVWMAYHCINPDKKKEILEATGKSLEVGQYVIDSGIYWIVKDPEFIRKNFKRYEEQMELF